MIKLRSEISPERGAMARFPPGGQSEIEKIQDAENRSGPHQQTEQQADSNKGFDCSNQVSEEDSVRQYQIREYGPVKTHGPVRDEILQVSLECTVGKGRSSEFIFTKEQEEDRRGNAHPSNRLRGSR